MTKFSYNLSPYIPKQVRVFFLQYLNINDLYNLKCSCIKTFKFIFLLQKLKMNTCCCCFNFKCGTLFFGFVNVLFTLTLTTIFVVYALQPAVVTALFALGEEGNNYKTNVNEPNT